MHLLVIAITVVAFGHGEPSSGSTSLAAYQARSRGTIRAGPAGAGATYDGVRPRRTT